MSPRLDVLVLACAVSAGIHAGLAPAHGPPFVVAAALLAAAAVVLGRRPASTAAVAAAALVLAGLLAGYAVAVVAGLPLVHPDPEPVDGLALATKAIEAVGLASALSLLPRPKGRSTWTPHAHRAPSRSS